MRSRVSAGKATITTAEGRSMSKIGIRITTMARDATDAVVALVDAAWPRSMPSREIDRLREDGYAGGASCDVYFLLSFDAPDWERALDAIHGAGFIVRESSEGTTAFVTVKTRLALRAFDLSLAAARLDRAVSPYGGFATLIGPALACRSDATRRVEHRPMADALSV